jgi:hypothetical protein
MGIIGKIECFNDWIIVLVTQGLDYHGEPHATESIRFDGIIGIITTQKKKRFSPTSIPFG